MNIQDLKKEMDLWADSANQRIVSSTNGLALQEAMRAQYIIDTYHTADCLSYKAFYDSAFYEAHKIRYNVNVRYSFQSSVILSKIIFLKFCFYRNVNHTFHRNFYHTL